MIVSLLVFLILFYGGAFVVEVIIVDYLLHDDDHWIKLIRRENVDQRDGDQTDADGDQTDADGDQTDSNQRNDGDAEKGICQHRVKRGPSLFKVHLLD